MTAIARVKRFGRFSLTPGGATFDGAAPAAKDFDDWCSAVQWVMTVHGAVMFWLGDLILLGETHYGETYTQVLDATGYAEQTCKNAVAVAKAIDPTRRHTDVLSFSHHEAVARLEPDDQKHWLSKAIHENWTRDELRAHVRADHVRSAGAAPTFWLVVSCLDEADRDQLRRKMLIEGRAVKMTVGAKPQETKEKIRHARNA